MIYKQVSRLDEKPVGKLVVQPEATREPRQPGSAKSNLVILAKDDAHREDFMGYVP